MVKRVQKADAAHTGTSSADKKADILIAIGATGSGKSTRIKGDIERRGLRRVLVWDAMHEYDKIPACKTLGVLRDTALSKSEFTLRFLPSFDNKVKVRQFDAFCRIGLAARQRSRAGHQR